VEFRRYEKIARLGTTDTEGILNGTVYVAPKLDGTNGSVWRQGDTIYFGSRSRRLGEGDDNAGFKAANKDDPRLHKILDEHPNWRLYGEWLCLSGDTTVRLVSGGKRGHVTTLREMYKYSTERAVETLAYIKKDGSRSTTTRDPWWSRNGMPSCFSYFVDEDTIKPQRISKIISTGDKQVFKIVTRKGYEISSTKDHKFLTNVGWKPLSSIVVGDVVAVSQLKNLKGGRSYGKGTRAIRLKFKHLRSSRRCAGCGSGSSLEVHHIDEDWRNNATENLAVYCKDCHGKQHNNITASNQSYDYEFDKIISIEDDGVIDCYDISMGVEENSSSFVANGFIVHNCPHTIRGYKKDAWRKFYIYDVYDGERFLKPDEWMEDISSAGLDYIFHSSLYKPTMEEVEAVRTLLSSKYMKEGEIGEGIVLKNFSFINKYGEKKYAKYINEFFHNRPKKDKLVHLIEDEIATEVTKELVDKTVAKILVAEDTDRWDRKTMIPRLIETVYHDVITEKLYDKLKKLKLPVVNFKLLKGSISRAIRENGEEYF